MNLALHAAAARNHVPNQDRIAAHIHMCGIKHAATQATTNTRIMQREGVNAPFRDVDGAVDVEKRVVLTLEHCKVNLDHKLK